MAQRIHITSLPWKGDLMRIDIRGALTAEDVPALDKEFAKRFSEGHDSFVVHLAQLTDMSLVGGAALIGQLRLAHERGGSVTVVQPSPEVERVLGSLGVLQLLHIVRDTAELIGVSAVRRPATGFSE
jgi:anti-anti-sigma factor